MTIRMNRAHSVPEKEFSPDAGRVRTQSKKARTLGMTATRRAASGA
jgi:hypothetical protein